LKPGYKIIILQEEPKQETLEEASIRLVPNRTLKTPFGTPYEITPTRERNTFKKGAKWQQEQDKKMYSEEDMINFHKWAYQKNRIEESDKTTKELLKEWFEQFKNK
jgi:NAD(P)H-dependent flavin oxidoreductase YrpB (nitropropane dioxygenase family)